MENKLPENILRLILKELIKEGFDKDDMFEIYESSSNMIKIEYIIKKFGLSIDYEDYGFYGQLFIQNIVKTSFKQTVKEGKLDIPKLKKFNVDFNVSVKKWIDEKWELVVESYHRDYIKEMIYNGDFSYYDGTMYDDDVTDSQTDDWDITNIEEIKSVSENTKTKKIIKENKETIKNELKELQMLKLMIDERIRLLTP